MWDLTNPLRDLLNNIQVLHEKFIMKQSWPLMRVQKAAVLQEGQPIAYGATELTQSEQNYTQI